MRIISGRLKGKSIHNPLDKNTRPLKDMVRESIFNILVHSKNQKIDVKNINTLDLFSGSGSFGIECLSRGAKEVYFCENYKNSLKILRKNLTELNLKNNSSIIEKNAYDISNDDIHKKKFDLIFLDPPFRDKNINTLLEKIKTMEVANKNCLIILHRSKKLKEELYADFKVLREQTYGVSKIIFGKF